MSRLYEHARRLRVHAIVCDRARRELDGIIFRFSLLALLVLALTGLLVYGFHSLGTTLQTSIFVLLGGVALAAGILLFARHERSSRAREVTDGVDAVFERAFERELSLGDRADDLRALWKSVRERTRRALVTVGAVKIPRLRHGERKRLDGSIDSEIPALRSEATK